MSLIIDCHGHYTVLPKAHDAWREAQKAAFKAGTPCPPYPEISDAEIVETIEANQLRLIKERGADLTIFSPRASAMAPHVGDEAVAKEWAVRCNDLIARVVGLFPETFVGVCMLPQSPKADMSNSIRELERCVTELGFIGCNLNPDPGGGHFTHPPLTDRYWYPFYEPSLRFIIPHGGGAVPYHWGRYRGLADMLKKPGLDTHLMNNVFFDTCVYHQPGVDLLADVIETKNILFGSEMVGAVRGIDPTTGFYFDDTKRYVDALAISDAERHAIFEGNARTVFPRLDARLKERGL
ncbi:MAG: 4-oxalomesaconate hydratase [Sphingomonadales bacterium 32-68-7]|nr:MAG: 4-oxalomesaconate hydratase [Sphingomonadales bacterium 32-68-7]